MHCLTIVGTSMSESINEERFSQRRNNVDSLRLQPMPQITLCGTRQNPSHILVIHFSHTFGCVRVNANALSVYLYWINCTNTFERIKWNVYYKTFVYFLFVFRRLWMLRYVMSSPVYSDRHHQFRRLTKHFLCLCQHWRCHFTALRWQKKNC